MKSFLQTHEWLNFQKSIGREAWRFDNGKFRTNIIKHDLPFGKNYLYIPHGPEILFDNIQSGLKNKVDGFFQYLKNLAQENKSIFIKMEPLADTVVEILYGLKRLKRSNKTIQPSKTVILNLELPEEDLLRGMHHKTRYNIRLAEKHGLQFEESSDIEKFWELLKKTAKQDQFSTHPLDYYKKLREFFGEDGELKIKIFFVVHEGKHLAGAVLMLFGDTVYYLHGAMDREYKSLMAPYLMHWEIMKRFKDMGYKFYDLWGIDARRWPGVTRFKFGWGGREVEYPGSFDLPVSKIWYLIYELSRRIF